jgi:hypothetical protein
MQMGIKRIGNIIINANGFNLIFNLNIIPGNEKVNIEWAGRVGRGRKPSRNGACRENVKRHVVYKTAFHKV